MGKKIIIFNIGNYAKDYTAAARFCDSFKNTAYRRNICGELEGRVFLYEPEENEKPDKIFSQTSKGLIEGTLSPFDERAVAEGCCYGIETDGAFAVVFRDSAYAPNGVRLLPTQLLSSGLNFLHFFVLLWLSGRVKRDGQVAGMYLVFYSLGRFVMEFFRGDLIRGNVGSLTTSQFISLFAAAAGVYVLARSRKLPEIADD